MFRREGTKKTAAEKRCLGCGIIKSLEEFHRHPRGRLGRQPRCKSCRAPELKAIQAKERPARARRERERRKRNPAAVRAADRRHEVRNRRKHAAKSAVNRAVASGRLVKAAVCENCGGEEAKLHGHHEDYARRLDVVWLCPLCHKAAHVVVCDGR